MVLMVFPPRGFNLALKFILLVGLILITTSYLSHNDSLTYNDLDGVIITVSERPVRPIWTPTFVDVVEDEEESTSTPGVVEDEESFPTSAVVDDEDDEEDEEESLFGIEQGSSIDYLKESFVQNFMDNEIDGPMDLRPLVDFCASRDYVPGLIFKCQPVAGGVGNVKNEMLNCLRFAFQAGASGFVLPEITARGSNLSDIFTNSTYHFDYLFDKEHFITSFTTSCPQIHLYENERSLPHSALSTANIFSNVSTIHPAFLSGLNGTHKFATSVLNNASVSSWNNTFWRHATAAPEFSSSSPLIITVKPSLLRFPLDYDPPAFVSTFGRLMKPRWEFRRVAAGVLYSMSSEYNLSLDASRGIEQGKFFGAHLRTSEDAVKAGWPNYTVQSSNYLSGAKKARLGLVYLTTGNTIDATKFTRAAERIGIKVTTKNHLLSLPGLEEELQIMKSLDATWDQWAIIDYEVLLRASQFGGMFESSYSWNAVMRRHVVDGNGTWNSIGEGRMGKLGRQECFKDGLSTVYGPRDLGGMRWQFPLALWP